MRGNDAVAGSLFSYVDLEKRVRPDHPLRVIRGLVNSVLADLSTAFDALYSPFGRESIPPERLLRALLLQTFYSIRSERQLVERIEFDLLFRWFVGLGVDDPVWDATTFTKNRDRLLEGDVASEFMNALLAQPKVKVLLSSEHFSVDGTLLEAWASTKSFRPKDGPGPPPGAGRNGEENFHGQKRSNETHASTTDPDARLYRKGRGKEAKLAFMGHALMENRNGLIVGAVAMNRPGFVGGSNFQIGWSPYEQNDEQILPRSPCPRGADGTGSRGGTPLSLGCGVIDFGQDWLFGAYAAGLGQAGGGGQRQAGWRAERYG